MKTYLSTHFEFEFQVNEQFIEAHYECGHDKITRIRELMCHIINVQHIWISRILNETQESEDSDDLPFHSWAKLNLDNQQQIRFILHHYDIDSAISYTNSDGEHKTKSLVQLLTHLLQHGAYHRGQINYLLRQHDLEPISCNWINFDMDNKSRG